MGELEPNESAQEIMRRVLDQNDAILKMNAHIIEELACPVMVYQEDGMTNVERQRELNRRARRMVDRVSLGPGLSGRIDNEN